MLPPPRTPKLAKEDVVRKHLSLPLLAEPLSSCGKEKKLTMGAYL